MGADLERRVAWFLRLLDAYDPGRPRPSRGRPNRALDRASRRAVPHVHRDPPNPGPDPHALDPIPPAPPASLLRTVPATLVPARPHGSYITTVGGYCTAGLVLHIAAAVLTLGERPRPLTEPDRTDIDGEEVKAMEPEPSGPALGWRPSSVASSSSSWDWLLASVGWSRPRSATAWRSRPWHRATLAWP